jgi:hypothetical protein
LGIEEKTPLAGLLLNPELADNGKVLESRSAFTAIIIAEAATNYALFEARAIRGQLVFGTHFQLPCER